jgi:ABC-type transport system involved in multi-copper enzyme maturation permease subunit
LAMFGTLTWICLVAALSAGLFFTSDSISEEKREGTLGFLFLTDLRGYDVVAGKLLATSLRGAFALLALFPILAIALMTGGVTGAQFWKTVLALLNGLIVSLMVGLFVSAVSRDSQKAMVGTLLFLLCLIFGGPLIDAAIAGARNRPFEPLLSFLSPGYVFVKAGDWGPTQFWSGLATTQILCWILFGLACVAAPRTWQQRSRRSGGTSSWSYAWRYGGKRRRARLRWRLIDRNPMAWLACRERWQSTGIWILATLVAAAFVFIGLSDVAPHEWTAWNSVALLFIWLIYLWAASQSGRFFVETRRSGLLELLLSAPVSERRIVNGQWWGLVRMFALPVGLLVAVHLAASIWSQVAMRRMMGGGPFGEMPLVVAVITAAATLITTLGNLVALTWFGMWMGLSSKSANWATVKTFLLVQVIPQMVFSFLSTVAGFMLLIPWLSQLSGGTGSAPVMLWYPVLTLGLSSTLMLLKNVGFFLLARRKLYESFRGYVTGTAGRYHAPVPPPTPMVSPVAVAHS